MSNLAKFSLEPQSLEQAMQYADIMAHSDMVPKTYQGKPGNVLVAVQMGMELGLKPMAALQNIAVVNGNPCLWGDGLRAVVLGSQELESLEESFDEKTMTATCIIKRRVGRSGAVSMFTKSFSKADAEMAGLWGRNTWKQYPKRMLQWRAFGFAARDAFADQLKGIKLAEEVQDYPVEREVNPQKAVDPKDIHAKLSNPSEADIEQTVQDEAHEEESEEFYPSDEAVTLSEWIFAAETKEQLHEAASKINEALANETISQQDREWLTHGYKAKQQELS